MPSSLHSSSRLASETQTTLDMTDLTNTQPKQIYVNPPIGDLSSFDQQPPMFHTQFSSPRNSIVIFPLVRRMSAKGWPGGRFQNHTKAVSIAEH